MGKLILVITTALFTATIAQAQTYPAKPIRLIVPQAAGSASDTVARIVAGELTPLLGQQVVVDNRGGASGMIGNELVDEGDGGDDHDADSDGADALDSCATYLSWRAFKLFHFCGLRHRINPTFSLLNSRLKLYANYKSDLGAK